MLQFDRKDSATGVKQLWYVTRRILAGFSLVLIVGLGLPVRAQAAKPSTGEPSIDKGVVFPPSQGMPSTRQDATALAILRSYQKSVGHTPWTSMDGTGEMIPETLRVAGVTSEQNATLSILGHRGYRLDIQTPQGMISIRMDGMYGAMQRPDGHVISMDAGDAATGLLAFPQFEDPAFPGDSASLLDQGTVVVDGTKLRRITAETPWANPSAKGQPQSGISITDLYFDPGTHLLIKSANVLQGTDPRLAHYMRVITYGDYRMVNGVQIPFRFRESVNGRRIWTLQLSQVQFNGGTSEENFRF